MHTSAPTNLERTRLFTDAVLVIAAAMIVGCGPIDPDPGSTSRQEQTVNQLVTPDPGMSLSDKADTVIDTLLGPVLTEVQTPSLKRTWIQEQLERLPNKLSYYRYKLNEAFVVFDGQLVVRASDQLLREIVIDQHRYGPDRFELRIKSGPWYSYGKAAPGKVVTISFGDDDGKRHYGFHGRIGSISQTLEDGGSTVVVIRGYAPRQSKNERRTRQFVQKRRSSVVQSIAADFALNSDVLHTGAKLPLIEQNDISDLGLVYQLARKDGFDAYLAYSGQSPDLTYKESSFVIPTSEARTRQFLHYRYSDLANRIAMEHGLNRYVIRTDDEIALIEQSNETDFDLLHRLATEIGYTFYIQGNELVFKPSASVPTSYAIDKTFPKGARRSDVAAAIAAKYGLNAKISVTALGAAIVQDGETDVELLHRLAHEVGYVAYLDSGTLHLVQPSPGSFRETDYLERRIRVNCRKDRSFWTKYAVVNSDPLGGLKDPEQVAVTNVYLDLYHSAASKGLMTKGNGSQTATTTSQSNLHDADQLLQDALETLDQVPFTSYSALLFKRHVARVYATSVLRHIVTSGLDQDAVRALLAGIDAELHPSKTTKLP